MNATQIFFLQIISDHLNGRPSYVQTGIDWDALATYAQNHQVSGIIYNQCKAFLPVEWTDWFEKKQTTELYYYCNRTALFRTISGKLSEKGIPFYAVKGFEIAKLYPVPALRTMGDCDIILHTEDRKKAHDIMMELGFEIIQKDGIEWMYSKSNMEFELHNHLLYDEIGNYSSSRRFVDYDWEYAKPTGDGTRFALDWSFHFLFLLLHLKKHLVHVGVGFRQFMDLAVVMRKQTLDWPWIFVELERQGLLRFTRVCFTLLHRWFETPLPMEAIPMDEDAFNEATEKIFANGLFGFNDDNNLDVKEVNAITQRKGPRWLARLRKVLHFVFPPYHHMYYVPEYAFIEGRPWLLPAAWCYRWYRAVRDKLGANGKRVISDTMVSNEKLDARERELAKWGL